VTLAAIQMMLLEILEKMQKLHRAARGKKPFWTEKLREILRDGYGESLSLEKLSKELNIHPVHLSRDFPKHFHCTFGEYVRKLRVEKSLARMTDKNLSLTEIAFECGFADQSHFLRCFKEINGVTPSEYRKLLFA